MSGGVVEGPLAVAGVALAVPGLVDLLVKYGEWSWGRVQSFRHAKKELKRLGEFGHQMAIQELEGGVLMTAKSFYLDEGCHASLKSALETKVQQLFNDCRNAQAYLAGMTPEDPKWTDKLVFTVIGERTAKRHNERLRQDKLELEQTLMTSYVGSQVVPRQILLDNSRFLCHQNVPETQIPGTSDVFSTIGDFRVNPVDGEWVETPVLIEKLSRNDGIEASLKSIASILYYRLPSDSKSLPGTVPEVLRRGTLPCLGYCMSPTPQLVFKLPSPDVRLQSLQTLIQADHGTEVRIPLDFRFQLARDLAEAVLRVNSNRLVHKSIRCNTILVVAPGDQGGDHQEGDVEFDRDVSFGDVYLSHWKLLHDATGPTAQSGSNEWTEDIYRHPNRQGLHVQERYNIGHDIYSLGVCLLEIGTWRVLVNKQPDGNHLISPLFVSSAQEEGKDITPDAIDCLLRQPTQVKNVLLKIAKSQLPQKMGMGYCRLVVKCLTALDKPSGFGNDVDFTKWDHVDQGIAFRDLVLASIADLTPI
ncbi:hypothetical protein MMC29_002265 [Sticta canariensis]|nr:hypothetical protein [Sticta canariensis]